MILGLIFAAIFVYIGVNLEPGLNTTVATITTPTYSSGVAGLNGVKKDSPTRWRHLVQKLLEFGGKLKCQYRAKLLVEQLREGVTTTKDKWLEPYTACRVGLR